MKQSKQPHVPSLIATDPAYRAIVKAVGFGKPETKAVIEAFKPAIEQFGEQHLAEVSKILLDFETHGEAAYCRIKPEYQVYCRQFLGPMPSEMDDWYKHPDGTERPGKPNPWPPHLPGPPGDLSVLTDGQLRDRLSGMRAVRGKSKKEAKAAKEEVARLEAECNRRNLPLTSAPSPSKPVKQRPTSHRKASKVTVRGVAPPSMPTNGLDFKKKSNRQLVDALHSARQRFNRFPPGTPAGKVASEEIDRLYEEFRRRKLVIPPLKVGNGKQPKGRKPLRHGLRRLATGRLKELLDRCQYETEKVGPDTVTHQEAKREIADIEAELRRRGIAVPGAATEAKEVA